MGTPSLALGTHWYTPALVAEQYQACLGTIESLTASRERCPGTFPGNIRMLAYYRRELRQQHANLIAWANRAPGALVPW